MKIVTLILVGLIIQFTAQAQVTDLSIKIEQEPSDWTPFMKKKVGHQLKKQVVLWSRLRSGPVVDTVSIEYYDPKGDRIRSIEFSGKERTGITTFDTSKDGKVAKWRSNRLKDKTIWLNTITFNANGKPAWFSNTDISSKGDTVSRALVTFAYNSKHQILERDDKVNGQTTIKKTYAYANDNMVKLTSKVAGSAGLIWYEYVYNAAHLPIKKVAHQSGPWGTAITKTNTYTYLDGLLATERYTNLEGDKKDVEVSYTYDPQRRIKSFRAVRDTLFREVSFQFSGELLKQINVKGNTINGFIQEYFINIDAPYTEKNEPFLYHQDFEYDDKGNLIRSTQFLNEIKYLQMDYHLEYY